MRREYCECKKCTEVYTDDGEWGWWDVCCQCGKELEGSYHLYNHYDGEDNDGDFY